MSEVRNAEILLLCASPLLALGMRHELRDTPCREISAAELEQPGFADRARLLIISPWHWQDLRDWLPAPCSPHAPQPGSPLGRLRGACASPEAPPCLYVGDLCIATVFQQYLPERCGLLGLRAQPGAVGTLARTLGENGVRSTTDELHMRYSKGIQRIPEAGSIGRFSTRELSCACGLALHMSQAEMAANLQLGVLTIKATLQAARDRIFEKKQRPLLAWFVKQALDLSDLP